MTRELSPSEAAARLGTATRTVQRWIATGRLPARRVGGRWRVAIDAIDAFTASAPSLAATETGRAIGTLFVANRGEIAGRIRRTADALGMRTVVPRTDGPGALDLLDVAAVVAAATAAGADAVHPGFGFLAESPDFAEAVIAAGLAWVGPPPDAIRTMGDKGAARRLASRLGIPVAAGYDDPDQSDAALAAAASRIGLPLLVKPAGGGGGKGIHVVRSADALRDAIAAARREGAAAFGDDRVILERFIEGPRHVEIQVLFDASGRGVHLGERDCSIQRRHQKILEETPSPGLAAGLRDRLAGAALELARAVGYVGAGTCEFLVDERDEPVFLEMNTRLQVEHPVTELVTGRDLVADQLRIAAGERLGFSQADVAFDGHAVEVRLYAEDAEAGFLPETGRVEAVRWPAGPGVRVDAGIEPGSEVSGRFDPMLAKVIAHGRDRAEALDRLARALDETVVLGLITNLRFLRWLVREPAVRDGLARVDTLERIWPPDDWARRADLPDAAWRSAAAALAGTAADATDPWAGGWRLNGPATVRIEAEGEARTVAIAPLPASEPALALVVTGDAAHVDVGGRSVAFGIASPPDVDRAAGAAARHATGATELVAPMPGSVVDVHAGIGDAVAAGAPVVTLEAMKMEHAVTAPFDGRVAGLRVGVRDQVVRGQVLAVVEPD
jgi:acetyl-CoA/propionyl-CoA carboxylase biotin carboxyl carrier protein